NPAENLAGNMSKVLNGVNVSSIPPGQTKDESIQPGLFIERAKAVTSTTMVENKPKKVLRLNPKTGTIGSPPTRKLNQPSYIADKRTSANRGGKSKTKIVTICYGQGEVLPSSIGLKIDQILKNMKMAAPMPEKT